MDTLKSNFLSAYYAQIDALDALYLKELPGIQAPQQSKNIPLKKKGTRVPPLYNSLVQKYSEMVEEGSWSQQKKKKRTKLTQNEYVEKILMDFGYQDECGLRTITLESTRRTLPNDERITVKLFNPEEEIKQDFGRSFDEFRPVTDKKNTQVTVKKEYPTISITNSDGSRVESIQNTTRKSDMTFRNSDGMKNFPFVNFSLSRQKRIQERSRSWSKRFEEHH